MSLPSNSSQITSSSTTNSNPSATFQQVFPQLMLCLYLLHVIFCELFFTSDFFMVFKSWNRNVKIIAISLHTEHNESRTSYK